MTRTPWPIDKQQEGDDQHRPHLGDRSDGETGDEQHEAGGEQSLCAEPFHEMPVRAALDHHQHETDTEEDGG